ncbi:MAG: tetratricopeptide repeat protein [Acaryochloridaceae cyanobacterium RL_2_7]|nr:tetratricopeptide repeat protein [Acaryochloridaceae cyanobacterium RL_2_7]
MQQEHSQGAKQLEDIGSQAQALGLLGHLYEQDQQWQSAQKLTQQALELALAERDSLHVAEWQWQLGRIYHQQSDQTRALQAYQQAVEHLGIVQKNRRIIRNTVDFHFKIRLNPSIENTWIYY